ncbi:MAG: hypothetical protein U5L04_10930 [Trueperaceae bacterium]|nr:hypothetical protein [Trueperaceae bacterium]
MKRITVTVPDELEAYLMRQDTPPNITTVVRVALREFLQSRQLQEHGFKPARKPFTVPSVEEKDAFGEADVSAEHDAYLADTAEHNRG